MQLGHTDGICSHPSKNADITVLDMRGVQIVKVKFCDCALNLGLSQEHRDQFLRYGWYPATVQRPETVATMNLLRLYEKMAFQAKISAHDFYQALVNVTDDTGMNVPKVELLSFMVCGMC